MQVEILTPPARAPLQLLNVDQNIEVFAVWPAMSVAIVVRACDVAAREKTQLNSALTFNNQHLTIG